MLVIIIGDNSSERKSFKYKTKIKGKTPAQPDTDDAGNSAMYYS